VFCAHKQSLPLTMCIPMYRYRLSELFRLKRGSGYPPVNIIQRLKTLKLFHNRGRRGGSQVVRSIPVITSHNKEIKPKQTREHKRLEVPQKWYSLPSLLLSNITSLTNKVDEVIATAQSTSADVVAITEAWQITPEVCTIQNFQSISPTQDK